MRALALSLVSALALSAAAFGPVRAQNAQDDGWEIIATTPGQTIAAAQYDSGISLAARCLRGEFEFLILGLPPHSEPRRTLGLAIDGVGEVENPWLMAMDGTVAYSPFPERLAQVLIGGGRLNLTIRQEEDGPVTRYPLDLPAQGKGLETALAACNRPAQDSRFATRAEMLSMARLGDLEWVRLVSPHYPSSTSATSGEATLLCRLGVEGQLKDCTVESERPAGAGFGRATLAATGRASLKAKSADTNFEGRWISFTVSFRLD
jgi:hypothetical protein